ncbi:MAG TPA: M10 family metallopeptidase C-terminal domain-containing protein, partial [Thermomicrobiales bacterium]|nr:M10 family metallopeptidase C-terminal domain-containing protein [Thermomicrobiales bacterium]
LQYMYGANYGASAHNTDTVYTWNSFTGQESIDGIAQATPLFDVVFMTVWDGGGADTYDFSNYTTDLSVDLAPGAWTVLDTSSTHIQRADLGSDGAGGAEQFARGNIANALIDPNSPSENASYIENATGGIGDDLISGNKFGNILQGLDGADTLNGLAGADTLNGGDGADQLNGGDNDDTLNGGIGADNLKGAGGADTLRGGAGDDFYQLSDVWAQTFSGVFLRDVFDSALEAPGEGVDTVGVSPLGRSLRDGSVVYSYVVGDSTDIENAVIGDGHDFDLSGNSLDNVLTGNSFANTLKGLIGDDTLNGNNGADTLIGGAGDDLYRLNDVSPLFGGDTFDTVREDANGGLDTVIVAPLGRRNNFSGVTSYSYGLGANVENAVVSDGHVFDLVGNELDNKLTGNAFLNTLTGNGGNDTLNGGGTGDTLIGGAGDDRYELDDVHAVFSPRGPIGEAFDDVQEDANGGIDTAILSPVGRHHVPLDGTFLYSYSLAANVENAIVKDGHAFDLTGNELDNVITGNASENTLAGLAGNDTLAGDGGADTLAGGAG